MSSSHSKGQDDGFTNKQGPETQSQKLRIQDWLDGNQRNALGSSELSPWTNLREESARQMIKGSEIGRDAAGAPVISRAAPRAAISRLCTHALAANPGEQYRSIEISHCLTGNWDFPWFFFRVAAPPPPCCATSGGTREGKKQRLTRSGEMPVSWRACLSLGPRAWHHLCM